VTRFLVGILAALVLSWLLLVVALVVVRPNGAALREAVRLLPDLLRMLRRLSVDRTLPRRVRWRIYLGFGYLALPIDLIPDFLPVVGYADDAVIVALVLRSVAKRAGPQALVRHWPGTPDGLAALARLVRLDLSQHDHEADSTGTKP
jgi:uncharacterized membrane protein YkvA (DUF1232 family)